ncbi:putative ferrochelatase [Gordonia effusa NBRC 100432]|uniref:Putative ferrochelatase n=1 Tax=Gordonia effusa NBRC 100432 TaxID=1077974 RepID=H0R0S1_9ACTN|nr:sirohydrochlorin chelatase [Gordonia effusa]GAB18672.1 putative ferrochelatase [Gordonia effusa NBRC 100432]
MSKMVRPALLLVAHGSRDDRFVVTAEQIRDAVAGELPGVAVELSYLDLNAPLVGDALATLGPRTDDVVVVPLLLGDGYHSRFDLPAILSAATRQRISLRTSQTPVVGDTSLVPALLSRLAEAGLRSNDGVLMCAVGSSDAGSDAQARRRAAELSERLKVPVEVVFATKPGEHDKELRSAVSRLEDARVDRIVLSPYFLSAGLLTERVIGKVLAYRPDSLVAAPIGEHRALIDAVTSNYRTALRGVSHSSGTSSQPGRDSLLHSF